MDATNISINQSRGVSINIEALHTIKKHFNIDTLVSKFKGLRVSGFKIYRKELRLVRTLSRAVDGHPTLSNIGLLLMGLALMVEIFLYA